MSRQARMIAAVLWVLLGFAWWGVRVNTSDQLPGQVLVTVALVVASWLVLWRPHLTLTADHVEVRNPFRTHVIPWAAINLIDTTWQVTLTTNTTRVAVWSAVSGGRHKSFWASRDQAEHLPASTYHGGVVKPGDLLGTESGEIAAVIRHYWEHRHHLPRQTAAETTFHTVDWVTVLGGGVTVVLSIAGLILISR